MAEDARTKGGQRTSIRIAQVSQDGAIFQVASKDCTTSGIFDSCQEDLETAEHIFWVKLRHNSIKKEKMNITLDIYCLTFIFDAPLIHKPSNQWS